MGFLTEDPTYLVGGLGLLAASCLAALWLTQQGKFLIWAGASLGLALLALAVDYVWVTDNERIEQTVYGLADAVRASDGAATLSFLDKDVRYNRGGTLLPALATRVLIETNVANAKFDFLQISKLKADAGSQSRRGTAEFQVFAGGNIVRSAVNYNFGSLNSTWSLGLRETSPGVWKVNRITPLQLPGNPDVLP